MAAPERRLFVGGRFAPGERTSEVVAPWDTAIVAQVQQASWAQIDEALALAFASRERLWTAPAGVRHRLCAAIAAGIEQRREELAAVICLEAGKPITAARAEVARAVWTFTLAAAASLNPCGEVLPVDLEPAQQGFTATSCRVPAGVVAAITPFNFPINLVAHKVAPALAVGAPVVLKPPPQAPSAALILAEIALASGAPAGALQVVACDNGLAERLACDPRVAVVSFTGSARVGWALKRKLGRARALLELGGNATVIVANDADLERAVERCAYAGYVFAGQVCISVQRVLIEERLYQAFLAKFRTKALEYTVGDPRAAETIVGPLIDRAAAERISSWLAEARTGGATVEGGEANGNRMDPALVTGAPRDSKIVCEEVFGPVVVLDPIESLEQGFAEINRSDYGLQAGLFTDNLHTVQRAFERLEVGALIVNEAPTFRSDGMPYGGVKSSGLGREGIRSAIEALCEPRLLVQAHC